MAKAITGPGMARDVNDNIIRQAQPAPPSRRPFLSGGRIVTGTQKPDAASTVPAASTPADVPAGTLIKIEWFTASGTNYTTPSLAQTAVVILLVIRSRSVLELADFSFASNTVTVPGSRSGDVIGVLYTY